MASEMTAVEIEYRYHEFEEQFTKLNAVREKIIKQQMDTYFAYMETILVDRICVCLCGSMGRLDNPAAELMPLYQALTAPAPQFVFRY